MTKIEDSRIKVLKEIIRRDFKTIFIYSIAFLIIDIFLLIMLIIFLPQLFILHMIVLVLTIFIFLNLLLCYLSFRNYFKELIERYENKDKGIIY